MKINGGVQKPLRVVDLFCGGGGISEGLRQAGFDIAYALDKNQAAVDTFSANHASAKVVRLDIEKFNSDELPEFDVLVGGPPCIEFSMSKGGRRNILDGLKLVQAYLRVVHERKPRYWIMENVPRIVLHIPKEIPLEWIGIQEDGFLEIPQRREFNCADFGVPQTRRRFLMGNYPPPEPTHAEFRDGLFDGVDGKQRWQTLGNVLDALPSPNRRSQNGGRLIADPNYDIRLRESLLTDHFYDVWMSAREIRSIQRAKQDHPYMGRMDFPDRADRPARTVVATQLGRETLVIHEPRQGDTAYRRATVRECACIQGFPLSYQFLGNNYGARYRVVGDAVPPPLVFRIGQRILEMEKRTVPDRPIVGAQVESPSPKPTGKSFGGQRRRFRPDRKFSELIPGKEVRGCRVELDNLGKDPTRLPGSRQRHTVEWRAMLYVGEGRESLKVRRYGYEESVSLLRRLGTSPERSRLVETFLADLGRELAPVVPDASTLQAVWCEHREGACSPERLVDLSASIVERSFPSFQWRDIMLPRDESDEIFPKRGLRVRIAAGLVAASQIARIANTGAFPGETVIGIAANPRNSDSASGKGDCQSPTRARSVI